MHSKSFQKTRLRNKTHPILSYNGCEEKVKSWKSTKDIIGDGPLLLLLSNFVSGEKRKWFPTVFLFIRKLT